MKNYKKLIVAALMLLSIQQSYAMEIDAVEQGLSESDEVSYIYYPSGGGNAGHAELEVAGTSFILYKEEANDTKPLQGMIEKATSDGWPFIRFVFKTTPEQMSTILETILFETMLNKMTYFGCSRGALHPLSQAGICSVPLPINISPLMTAAYLASGKKLGLNRVSKIEYYGNPSLRNSVAKMLKGSLTEVGAIAFNSYNVWLLVRFLAQGNQTESPTEL